jgi:hypothetical protein
MQSVEDVYQSYGIDFEAKYFPPFLIFIPKKEASILGIADISKFTDPDVIQTVK